MTKLAAKVGLRCYVGWAKLQAHLKQLQAISRLADKYNVSSPKEFAAAERHVGQEGEWCWYRSRRHGDLIGVKAHWDDASSPIIARVGRTGEVFGTPFQVADSRHNDSPCWLSRRGRHGEAERRRMGRA